MSELWSIHIPGPDEYHAAPSKDIAEHMAKRHNIAMDQWYKEHGKEMHLPIECTKAKVTIWPHDESDHAEELEPFCREDWGLESGAVAANALNTSDCGNHLMNICHKASSDAGWWNITLGSETIDLATEMRSGSRFGKALAAEKLCLVHSEVSEAMEGHRKGLMDDKLPHRPMTEVECADAVIRIADFCGAMGYDLGGAIAEKLAFNANRPDHKPEARAAAGGKAY